MANGKLTPKQEAFVAEYLVDMNGAAAYRRAGYKASTNEAAAANAARLIATDSISRAIAAAAKARTGRLEITADMVVTGLHDEATFCGDGSSHSARVSAWGLLGQHLGMFKTVKEVRKRVVVKVLRGASLEEL